MLKFKIKKFSAMPKLGSRDLVGLDLSSSHLKITHAAVALNKFEVIKLISRNISGLSDEELIKAVRESMRELQVNNPFFCVVIPSHLVITKNIEIPSTETREIKEIISLQAGRHTPYSREEIIVDFVEIGTYKNSYTKVLLVIVARSIIQKQFEILEKAGIRPEKVFLAAEGLSFVSGKLFKSESESYPTNIVHVDENFTDFIIVFRNKPVFIRSIPIGTQHLLATSENYESRFVDEVKRSLEAYQSEDIEKVPNTLILAGAIDEVKPLEAILRDSLHLAIKPIPYLANIPISEQGLKSSSATKRISFMNVISSLYAWDKIKVNLVPEEIKLRRSLEERAKDLIKTGILVLTIFVLIFFILMTKIFFKAAYLKRLDVKYQALNQDSKSLEKKYAKVSRIKEYLARRGLSLEVLNELYTVITPDLQVSEVRFDDQGKFTVRGTAESMSSVFGFVENLEKSKYFKDVKTKYTTKRKEGQRDVTDFEIASSITK